MKHNKNKDPLTGHFRIMTKTIRRNAVEAVANLPHGEGYQVKIVSEKETRSAVQHRLKWVWCGQIEKDLIGQGRGYDKNQWNDYFKGKFAMPILIAQDESYVPFFEKYSKFWQYVPKEDRADVLLIFGAAIQTEWMHVKGMSEFLDNIDKFAASKGVALVTPEDLKWARECQRVARERKQQEIDNFRESGE